MIRIENQQVAQQPSETLKPTSTSCSYQQCSWNGILPLNPPVNPCNGNCGPQLPTISSQDLPFPLQEINNHHMVPRQSTLSSMTTELTGSSSNVASPMQSLLPSLSDVKNPPENLEVKSMNETLEACGVRRSKVTIDDQPVTHTYQQESDEESSECSPCSPDVCRG